MGADIEFKIGGDSSPLQYEIKAADDALGKFKKTGNEIINTTSLSLAIDRVNTLHKLTKELAKAYAENDQKLRSYATASVQGIRAQADAAAKLRHRYESVAASAKKAADQVSKMGSPTPATGNTGYFNSNAAELDTSRKVAAANATAKKEAEQAAAAGQAAAEKLVAAELKLSAARQATRDTNAKVRVEAKALIAARKAAEEQAVAAAAKEQRLVAARQATKDANAKAVATAKGIITAVRNEEAARKQAIATITNDNKVRATNARILQNMAVAQQKAAAAESRAVISSRKAAAASKKLTSANELAAQSFADVSRVVAIAQGPLGPVAGRLTALATGVRQIGLKALALGGMFTAMAATMRHAIPAAIDLQRTQSVLAAATVDAGRAFTFVIEESRRTGQNFALLAGSYGQLSAAAKGTALQGKGVEKVFKSINTAALALRLDVHQTKGALKAIEQMISKGTVSSEELRQQLGERLPGAFRMAADAMGMTTVQFSKAVAQGKILADDLIPRLATVIEERYGKAADAATKNVGVAFDRLSVEMEIFFSKMVSSGALSALAEGLNAIRDILHSLADNASIVAASAAFATVGSIAVALAIAAKKVFAVFSILIPQGYRVARSNLAAAASATKMALSYNAATKSANSLAVAQKALSGLVGLTPWGRAWKGIKWVGNALLTLLPAASAATAALYTYKDAQASAADEANNTAAKISRTGDYLLLALQKQRRMEEELATMRAKHVTYLAKLAAAGRDTTSAAKLYTNAEIRQGQVLAEQIQLVDDLRGQMRGLDGDFKQVAGTISQSTMDALARIDKALTTSTLTKNERLLASIQTTLALEKTALGKNKEELDQYHKDIEKQNSDIAKGNVSEASLEARKKLVRQQRGHEQAIARLKEHQAHVQGLIAVDNQERENNAKDAEERRAAIEKKAAAKKAFEAAKAKAKEIASLNSIEAQRAVFATKRGSVERAYAKQHLALVEFTNRQELARVGVHGKALLALIKKQKEERDLFLSKQAEQTGVIKAAEISNKAAHKATIASSGVAEQAAKASNRSLQSDIGNIIGSGESPAQQAARKIAEQKDAEEQRYAAASEARKAAYEAQKAELAVQGQSTLDLTAEYQAAERAALAEHEQAKTQLILDEINLRNSNIMGLQQEFGALFSDNQQVNLNNMLDGIKAFTEESKGFAKMEFDQKLSIASKGFGALSGLMEANNRKAFEVGKAAAVAQATVDGIGAVMKAANSAPFPFNLPLMALMGGIAAMNVQKILATKFKGGAGAKATTGSGGGGIPSIGRVQPQAAPNLTPQNQNQRAPIQIYVNGVITQDQLVNDIVPNALKSQVANNDFVLIDQNSANASLLAAA